MSRGAPDYDAIVVGSGMTGGWAAKELTELGLRTLVLDAGRPIVPNKDFHEHTPPWEMPFRGLGDRQTVARPCHRGCVTLVLRQRQCHAAGGRGDGAPNAHAVQHCA